MHSFLTRLVVAALAAATVTALVGGLAERVRFGNDTAAARLRLQTELQHRFDDVTARLRAISESIGRESALVERALSDRNQLPQLFARLEATRVPSAPPQAVTVYASDATGQYRPLAWSEGAAEDLDPLSVLLANATRSSTVVLPGTLGLRLVAIAPVRTPGADGRVVAVVTVERVLTTGGRIPLDSLGYPLTTSLGEVRVWPADPGDQSTRDDRVVVVGVDGRPLVDAVFVPTTIEQARGVFRARVVALALVPLLLLLLVVITRALLDRRVGRPSPRAFLLYSCLLALTVMAAGLALTGLARFASAPSSVDQIVLGLTAMGVALALPVAVWWRGSIRRPLRLHVVRGVLELLAGGLAATAILAATALAIDRQLQAATIDPLASPLFPFNAAPLMAHLVRLFLALAAMWSATALHARLFERWRIQWHHTGPAALAIALATLPTAALGLASVWIPALTAIAPIALGAAFASAVAALSAAPLRRRYRRASQSTRLLLLFGATVLPVLVIDPIVSVSAQRATESAIESVHGPATIGHPAHLRAELALAMDEIDRMADLPRLLAQAGATAGTDLAFRVWSQTGLSRGRLTSAVELYRTDGVLASRFALNVPEYEIYTDQTSADVRCGWDVYGEAGRIGAEELRLLHAERGLCDDSDTVYGSIVMHVILDYRALPYLSARNPYDDLLRVDPPSPAAVPRGIRTVVYGWSRLPLFSSTSSAWSIDLPLLERLERSRESFWTTLPTDHGISRVFFMNDRSGIYAVGYPVPSAFDHLARLAETTALAALVFVVLLAATTVAFPLTSSRQRPLRAVVQEIRTSFYRKLFLFFVFTAIVPVLVLALTFSAYMGDQLRSDVETEAVNAVTVARRVLEDTIALQQVPLTDDVMVWIGRVINQDVNIYEAGRLRATSQRDLFDHGVLAERTPARAYRAVVLDRVPAFVEEQRAGPFTYLVAASPVPGLGTQAVLSVPLAPRQQEIEREISDLNRGVLFGAVCVMLMSAGLGAWVARRVADPVARLTRATRQIASGRLDVRIVADTADELRRLVSDFNSMAATLRDQRAELGRAHELKAWADMSRQVAHDVKNPLTPIQLAAEHLQRVHEDQHRPLGPVFDQCINTVLKQVRLLRQIASEFSTFAANPTPTLTAVPVRDLLEDVVRPYRAGLAAHVRLEVNTPRDIPAVRTDRTLLARALTNLVENALQAMPQGGTLALAATHHRDQVAITVSDDGIGMTEEALARAFEPHFSTKTGGSGLGLANARRNIESCGGTISATSEPGHGVIMTITLPAVTPDGREGV